MTFFVDNNLGHQVAAGLLGFGEKVVHLKQYFPGDTADTDWLRFVGERGYVAVMRDLKILQNPAERAALREYRVRTFFLGGKNLRRCDIIRQVVRNWPMMKQLASTTPGPFAFRVPANGSISSKRDRIPL